MGQYPIVKNIPLPIIPAEGGPVLHMLRNDSPLFARFGEIYFSEITPSAIKAWKRHAQSTQHITVPVGTVHVVTYDPRPDSPNFGVVQEFSIGRPDNYTLLCIPPLIWYGFKTIGSLSALIANCTDTVHCPDEAEKIPADTGAIPYRWE